MFGLFDGRSEIGLERMTSWFIPTKLTDLICIVSCTSVNQLASKVTAGIPVEHIASGVVTSNWNLIVDPRSHNFTIGFWSFTV